MSRPKYAVVFSSLIKYIPALDITCVEIPNSPTKVCYYLFEGNVTEYSNTGIVIIRRTGKVYTFTDKSSSPIWEIVED